MTRNSKLPGHIPRKVGNMMNLVSLALGGNQFSSRIPGLWKLRRLEKLDLSNSCLSGAIPSSSLGLKQLLMLNSSWNQLSGSVVSNLGHNVFNRRNTNFPDRLNSINRIESLLEPVFWELCKEVLAILSKSVLDDSHNKLTGSFPEMRFAYNVDTLDLSYSDYHFRNIPKWIGNTSLKLVKCGIKMKLNNRKPTAFHAKIVFLRMN
ncbi:UNVERIFIED_CONTAM: hypothetical protein Sindi_2077300 [Sesamum indicum]